MALTLADKGKTGELIQLLHSEDPHIRMRAFDAVEKLSRLDRRILQPFAHEIFNLGDHYHQREVLWHWCQIIPRLDLTDSEVDYAFWKMNSLRGSDSKIVWTFALQGMFDLVNQRPDFLESVNEALSEDLKRGSGAVKARCRKLIEQLKH
ncbi:MAG: hypothetical protein ABL958_11960 [Bdellovibrionia bacterium]